MHNVFVMFYVSNSDKMFITVFYGSLVVLLGESINDMDNKSISNHIDPVQLFVKLDSI